MNQHSPNFTSRDDASFGPNQTPAYLPLAAQERGDPGTAMN